MNSESFGDEWKRKNIEMSISSWGVLMSFNDCRQRKWKYRHNYLWSCTVTCRKGNCQLKTNPKCLSFAKESLKVFACEPHMTLLTVIISHHCYASLQFARRPWWRSINKMCITSVDQYECDIFYDSFIVSVLLYRHFRSLFFRCHSTWTQLKFELKNSFDIVDMNEINNRQFTSFDLEMIVRNHYIIFTSSFYWWSVMMIVNCFIISCSLLVSMTIDSSLKNNDHVNSCSFFLSIWKRNFVYVPNEIS